MQGGAKSRGQVLVLVRTLEREGNGQLLLPLCGNGSCAVNLGSFS